MKKRWNVAAADNALAGSLAKELGLLPITAQLLINRGLVDTGAATLFLRPSLADLPDPFLMKDMDKAVERIRLALQTKEKIAVWGDYDVDGTTACALLYQFFRELGVPVITYIPDRHAEGYGLNTDGLARLGADGVRLVITVDCGSTNHEAVAFANSLGIDVIITDHHEIPEPAPAAYALINPKRQGCAYPFKGLAGVGVAFNLAIAIRARLRASGAFLGAEPNLKRYLDLVCIGTVADVVPLVGVNRVLVSCGLRELSVTARLGIKALTQVARLAPGAITAENIAFQLAPRINAAGRLAKAATAFRLLITGDAGEAAELAAALDVENGRRQKIEEEILKEALLMLGPEFSDKGDKGDKGVVLAQKGWNAGVIGIVASRLAERLGRPVVMIALDKGVGKGSARGIRSFDMLEGLRACAHLLTRFGGHKAAAGLTLPEGNIELFREEFVKYADAAIMDDSLVPEMSLDASITFEDLSERLAVELQTLTPFGSGNPEPLLRLTGADIVSTTVVGTRHLRFKIRCGGRPQAGSGQAASTGSGQVRAGRFEGLRTGIGFGLASLHPIQGQGYSLACSPYMDEWQGSRSLKLRIKDVAPAD